MITGDAMRDRRSAILRAHGAGSDVVDEVLAYSESGFDSAALEASRQYPLVDEPFVDAWQQYADAARERGTTNTLRENLIQLHFPVETGMSERHEYQDATRRGILPPAGAFEPGSFADAAGIEIRLHPTPAGRLPVVIATARADFEHLILALTRRNEPQALPASMGACIVGGYNDWSRVRNLRAVWSAQRAAAGTGTDDAAWRLEFQRIAAMRELYQDRFVVLSRGPYSGVAASELGLSDDEWSRLSLVIRMEHECAHYFTRRVFGSMRNSLLDELIADYTGIVVARGQFEPRWLEHFMGVEHDEFRRGGRLENYRGAPALGDAAFIVLQALVRSATCTLDHFDRLVRGSDAPRALPPSLDEIAWSITAIAATGLEGLAAPGAADMLYASYTQVAGVTLAVR